MSRLAVVPVRAGALLTGGADNSSSSLATLPIQKQAKEAGFPAANCK